MRRRITRKVKTISKRMISSAVVASLIFGGYCLFVKKNIVSNDTKYEAEVDVSSLSIDANVKNSAKKIVSAFDETVDQSLSTTEETVSEETYNDDREHDLVGKSTITGVDVIESGVVRITFSKVDDATEYDVYASKDKNQEYKYIGSTDENEFVDDKAPVNKYTYYRIKAKDGVNTGDFSDAVKILPLGVPKDITTKTINSKGIGVNWEDVKGAHGYMVLRASKSAGTYRTIANVKDSSYVDKSVAKGKSYFYKIIAYSNSSVMQGQSSRSKEGVALRNPEITEISNVDGSKELDIRWNKVRGAQSYKVYRLTDDNRYKAIAHVDGGKTHYVDKDREGGKVYSYKVVAFDEFDGKSGASETGSQMAIDADKKMVALTYDDGPSKYTPLVLDACEKYDAHVTFFVIGRQIDGFSDYIVREHELGCEIGNHTWDHELFKYLSHSEITREIDKVDEALYDLIGEETTVTRPPGGGIDSSDLKRSKHPIILWDIDTLDWKTKNTKKTIKAAVKGADDGSIILMHDLHESTAKGADAIMKALKDDGYQLVTVTEMAAYRGGLKNDEKYFSINK